MNSFRSEMSLHEARYDTRKRTQNIEVIAFEQMVEPNPNRVPYSQFHEHGVRRSLAFSEWESTLTQHTVCLGRLENGFKLSNQYIIDRDELGRDPRIV